MASVAGTSAMTAFSFATAEIQHNHFKEPVLLKRLIKRLLRNQPWNPAIAGWLLHYSMGTFFSTTYDRIWQKTKSKPTLLNGILFGAVNGAVGAGVWKATFELHPDPPKHINIEKYYGHLLMPMSSLDALLFWAIGCPRGLSIRVVNSQLMC